jgi:hypothetical protein
LGVFEIKNSRIPRNLAFRKLSFQKNISKIRNREKSRNSRMADQKKKYMPKSQKGLFLIGKRFFDRPPPVQELIDRAGATNES